jgi:hypothetical protein
MLSRLKNSNESTAGINTVLPPRSARLGEGDQKVARSSFRYISSKSTSTNGVVTVGEAPLVKRFDLVPPTKLKRVGCGAHSHIKAVEQRPVSRAILEDEGRCFRSSSLQARRTRSCVRAVVRQASKSGASDRGARRVMQCALARALSQTGAPTPAAEPARTWGVKTLIWGVAAVLQSYLGCRGDSISRSRSIKISAPSFEFFPQFRFHRTTLHGKPEGAEAMSP